MIIKGKTIFVYDIEVFPNFFSCAIKNTESGNIKVYEISEWQNDLGEIVKLFQNSGIYFCGYNNLHYDDPIINHLWIHFEELRIKPVWEINNAIKELSDTIINTEGNNFSSWSKYKYAHLFPSLDLLAMKFSNKLRVGLKAMQVSMEYHNVQEYSGDFTKNLKASDRELVKSYNINDIESTEELLNRSIADIELRLGIEKQYGISALNKDGVNLGMEIIKTRYLQKTGLNWNDIKDLRSPCENLCLKDIIFDFIKFDNPILQQLLSDLKSQCINPNDNSFERKFEIGGLKHTFGLGGLHSDGNPEIFIPTSSQMLVDKDVTSLYPSIVIEHRVCPEHLNPDIFIGNFAEMKQERVIAKKNGDKITNETLKLALNGFTGNLQSQFSWVYSPKAALTIRINGQLMLCMLAEKIASCGARLLQTNTDGIFYLCENSQFEKIEEVCKEWEKITKLNLEADYFERFYQYAINDYLGIKKGWSETHDPKFIKKKGLFIDTPILGKGLAPMIVPIALREYFVNGIDPEKTIKECQDILKFCTFQKPDKQFQVFWGDKKVTHINRYYMSLYGKPLAKQRCDKDGNLYGSITAMCASSPVTIYNTFDDIPIEKRDINYHYYLNEVYKIIYPMEVQQLTLF